MQAFDEQEMIQRLDSPEFRALFKTNPYRHAAAIVSNWIIIIATIYLAVQFPAVWTYLIAVFVVGARMHALAILVHDATHYRFLKNRTWNDRWTNLLCMYPIFSSLSKYRPNHLKHHQHLNTEDDPDWIAKLTKREFQFPKTKSEFLLTVASYLLLYQGAMDAYWFLKRFNVASEAETPSVDDKYLRPAFYLILAVCLTVFGGWSYFLLFWVVPYFTTFFMVQYIRSVAEHFGEMAYEDALSSSRTVMPNLIERFLIAPHHVGYHLEHHLYPGVPFYHLPKLHAMLMEQEDYAQKAHITQSYTTGLLNELGANRLERVPVKHS